MTTTLATSAEARQRVSAIRNALALADDLLARAYEARDWQVLGHPSWEAYCAAELPELRHLKLRKPDRQARHAALFGAGASVREAAAATGASIGTAHNDRQELTPTPAAPARVESRADQVVRLVAAAGLDGRTCAELERSMRAHHGIVSGALSRVARQGRVVHVGTRNGYGVYVTQHTEWGID
jgi:hypothetical protein